MQFLRDHRRRQLRALVVDSLVLGLAAVAAAAVWLALSWGGRQW